MDKRERYIRELEKNYRNGVKHFLRVSRDNIFRTHKKLIILNSMEFSTTLKGVKGRPSGNFVGNVSKMADKMNKDFEPITKKYADKIFAETQRLVPVDKKYIGQLSKSGEGVSVVRQRGSAHYIPVMHLKKIEDFTSMDAINAQFGQKESKRKLTLNIKRGTYVGEEAEFINHFLKDPNKRKKYLIYSDNTDDYKLKFHSFSPKNNYTFPFKLSDIKPASGVTSQESGGNRELKRSGRIEKVERLDFNEYRIIYDAYEDRSGKKQNGEPREGRWKKFHYAQVQHDNVAYNHKRGEALYVKKAFDKYREDYRKEIDRVVRLDIKEFNRK